MRLNCDGDYRLQEEWLKKHTEAGSTIVYDTKNDLPVKAEYPNPIYQAYVTDVQQFFHKVRECTLDQDILGDL